MNAISRLLAGGSVTGTGRMFPAVSVLLLAASCLLPAGCGQRSREEPVLVGHVATFSGPDKHLGDHARQGIDLAVDEVDQDGNLILGRRVAVLHVNGRGDRDAVQHEAVRLITVNRVVGLLGGTELSQAEGMAPAAQSHHVPLVTVRGTSDRAANDYVFFTGLSPACRGKVLGRFAGENGRKKLLVLLDGSPGYGTAASELADAFANEFAKHEGSITRRLSFKSPAEFKELVGRIKEDAPAAILFAGTAEDLAKLHQAGLDEKVRVLFGGEEGSLHALQADPIGNEVYLVTAFAADGNPPKVQEFVKRYETRFGLAADVHAALAYDNTRILFEGIRQARSLEGPKVRKALADLKDFESLTGPLSFGNDSWAVRTAFVIRLEKRTAKTVQTFAPEGP